VSKPARPVGTDRRAALSQTLGDALAHHRAGRLNEAEAGYRKLLKAAPNHPDALHMLGTIANSRGQPERALKLIRKALEVIPNFADAHLNLGNAFHLLGQPTEAIECYRRAIALRPGFAAAHSSLARELCRQGAFVAAAASAQRAAELDPLSPDAFFNLGVAMRSLGRLNAAEAALRQSLALRPHHAESLRQLAVIYTEFARFGDARRCNERLVALAPSDPLALRALGMSQFRCGETKTGLANLRRATDLAPDFAPGWLSLGWALRALGRFDEAVACFRRAGAIDPNLAEAHRSLAVTGRASADPAEIERLGRSSADLSRPSDERIAAGFALGEILDKADRFDEAFAHFAAANALADEALIAAGRGYDRAALEARVGDLIKSFSATFFAAASRRDGSNLPVFIVGMPRSGTTLVEQIAASHSKVFGAGELTEVSRLAAELREPEAGEAAAEAWRARALPMAEAHRSGLAKLGGDALRVIDKQPDNVFHLGLVAALFPGSRVILCQRDPRDICLSNYFQFFAGGNAYSYNLVNCAHRYLQVERLVAHWRQVLPLQILDVRYEHLVADPEAQSRRLIEFLGLEWEPACLEFHRTERVVITQSTWQVRQPLYSRSAGRWRSYERHLGPLLGALGDIAPDR